MATAAVEAGTRRRREPPAAPDPPRPQGLPVLLSSSSLTGTYLPSRIDLPIPTASTLAGGRGRCLRLLSLPSSCVRGRGGSARLAAGWRRPARRGGPRSLPAPRVRSRAAQGSAWARLAEAAGAACGGGLASPPHPVRSGPARPGPSRFPRWVRNGVVDTPRPVPRCHRLAARSWAGRRAAVRPPAVGGESGQAAGGGSPRRGKAARREGGRWFWEPNRGVSPEGGRQAGGRARGEPSPAAKLTAVSFPAADRLRQAALSGGSWVWPGRQPWCEESSTATAAEGDRQLAHLSRLNGRATSCTLRPYVEITISSSLVALVLPSLSEQVKCFRAQQVFGKNSENRSFCYVMIATNRSCLLKKEHFYYPLICHPAHIFFSVVTPGSSGVSSGKKSIKT
ncbi:uncharacterized protein LOC142027135 [Buteo buteo]|uniref:uncharacterized protein LOC142027135 n=1 Tax=Buteo buteo TaxID=30397 RepID=UPI003EB70625